jgi:uncharacterized membrane protein (UPF0127 family)
MKLRVELAADPESRERGLMFRKSLSPDSGMLFSFKYPTKMSFWGLNTYIPLEVAFINEAHEIVEIKEVIPMSTKAVRCETLCRYAVEANIDFFRENNIRIGDRVSIEGDVVTFRSREEEV